ELEDWKEWNGLPVWDAVRLLHGNPLRAATLEKLETEATLADSGLRHDPHHLPVAVDGAGEGGLEGRHLVHPADEAREAAPTRHVEAGPHGPHVLELVDPHQLAHALHRRRSKVTEAEVAVHQARRVLAHVDAVGRRNLLHARGEPDGVALCRVVH